MTTRVLLPNARTVLHVSLPGSLSTSKARLSADSSLNCYNETKLALGVTLVFLSTYMKQDFARDLECLLILKIQLHNLS